MRSPFDDSTCAGKGGGGIEDGDPAVGEAQYGDPGVGVVEDADDEGDRDAERDAGARTDEMDGIETGNA